MLNVRVEGKDLEIITDQVNFTENTFTVSKLNSLYQTNVPMIELENFVIECSHLTFYNN